MIVVAFFTSSNANNANNELHDHHPCSTNNEERPTTEALDRPEGDGRRAHVDESSNESNEERVVDRPKRGEEYSAEIENEVDASKLLHHLHEDT